MSVVLPFLQRNPRNDQLIGALPSLRRYARALTGERALADELVQDCIARACEKWKLWRPGTDLRAWLFTIMHNTFMSQTRYNSYREHESIDSLTDSVEQVGLEVDELVALRVDVDRALQELPAAQRAIILLVVLENMSYDQVAHTLGLPIGTVMSRLSRARAKLSSALRQEVVVVGGAPTTFGRAKASV